MAQSGPKARAGPGPARPGPGPESWGGPGPGPGLDFESRARPGQARFYDIIIKFCFWCFFISRIVAGPTSVIPSEAICEFGFSRCGYIYDKTRNRLAYSNVELIMLGVFISEYHQDLLTKCFN